MQNFILIYLAIGSIWSIFTAIYLFRNARNYVRRLGMPAFLSTAVVEAFLWPISIAAYCISSSVRSALRDAVRECSNQCSKEKAEEESIEDVVDKP